jgi:hypothetical protein
VSRRAAEDIKTGSVCSLSVVGGSMFMNDVSSTSFYTMLHMSIFYVFSSTQNAEENSRQTDVTRFWKLPIGTFIIGILLFRNCWHHFIFILDGHTVSSTTGLKDGTHGFKISQVCSKGRVSVPEFGV